MKKVFDEFNHQLYEKNVLYFIHIYRLGLDPNVFNDIINSSTGRCWSSEIYNPVPGLCPNAPANNEYKGGFSTELITKVS